MKTLPAQKVVVRLDKGHNPEQGLYGGENFYINFPGCTILQLEPSTMYSSTVLPVTLTVGGKCYFTKENYKDFYIMMRTTEQARQLQIVPNGNFDWPDVRGFMTCPVCGCEAEFSTGDGRNETKKDEELHYWLLYYPLMQIQLDHKTQTMTVGSLTICRLTCVECFENLVADLTVEPPPPPPPPPAGGDGRKTKNGSNTATTNHVPVLDVLEEAGTISFLGDGPLQSSNDETRHAILDAWTLYMLWENTGAWEALQIDLREVLSRSLGGGGGFEPTNDGWKSNQNSVNYQPMLEMKTAERRGTKCDNVSCARRHGKICPVTGERVRLNVTCDKCKSVSYCSTECRTMAASDHQNHCLQKQQRKNEKRHSSTMSSNSRKEKEGQCRTCKHWLPYSSLKKCSACKVATYCSVDCQRKDWKNHRPICAKR